MKTGHWRLPAVFILGSIASAAFAQSKARSGTLIPSDESPRIVTGEGRNVIAIYQYRIEFFELGASDEMRVLPRAALMSVKPMQVFRDGKEIPFTSLAKKSALTFKHAIEWRMDKNLLVCTNPVIGYAPSGDEEIRKMRASGHERYFPWINQKGELDNFCGVISSDGKVVFRFNVTQKDPAQLHYPLLISNDGRKAVLGVGTKSTYSSDEVPTIGATTAVIIWESPGRVSRLPANRVPREIAVHLRK